MKNLLCNTTLAVIFVLLASATALNAQCILARGRLYGLDGVSCTNAIVTAVPFLRIVSDARSGAMGDAGIAISADANAIHFNASKIAFAAADMSLTANYTPWLRSMAAEGIHLAHLTGFKKIDDRQAIGFGWRYFSPGQLEFRGTNGEPLNIGKAKDLEFTLAYARKISDHFSAGISGKFIYSTLAVGQPLIVGDIRSAGVAGAADLSFTYETRADLQNWVSNLRIGLVLANIGSKMSYNKSIHREYLPANLGLGAAWEMQLDDFNAITLTADVNKLMVPTPCPSDNSACDRDGNGRFDYKEYSSLGGIFKSFGDAPEGFREELRELMYSLGVEYWHKKQLAIRAGYFTESILKGGRTFFTTGLGFKYKVVGLNLSYMYMISDLAHPLDNTLRFSVLFDFSASRFEG